MKEKYLECFLAVQNLKMIFKKVKVPQHTNLKLFSLTLFKSINVKIRFQKNKMEKIYPVADRNRSIRKMRWIGSTQFILNYHGLVTLPGILKVRLNTFVAMLLKEYKKVKLITLAMLTDQEHIRRKFTSTRLLPYTMENDLSERGSLLKLSNVSRTFSCKTFYFS